MSRIMRVRKNVYVKIVAGNGDKRKFRLDLRQVMTVELVRVTWHNYAGYGRCLLYYSMEKKLHMVFMYIYYI